MNELTKENLIGQNKLSHEDKINRFEFLLRKTNRQGVDKVIEFARSTDFYTAPASSKYHSNYDGGLLDHSLSVYTLANEYFETMKMMDPEMTTKVKEDNIIISSLLHDFCKICMYRKTQKWKKDSSNMWVSYDAYDIEDTFPIGHGEKSVIMLQNIGLQMTPDEMLAIRYHMGNWENGTTEFEAAKMKASRMAPLIILLQMADFSSSILFEKTIEK